MVDSKVHDRHRGIRLDLGCGQNKERGFVGIDKRPLEEVDIVHDIEVFPFPIDDNECHMILARHILEHIKPWLTIDLFNELWRITKPGGQLIIALPFAGSAPFWQDPTHCNGFNEVTFQYFDPTYPLYGIYKPRPWLIDKGFPMWQENGIMECVMSKVVPPEENANE